MKELNAYNRAEAIRYAQRWAYDRNPAYYDFSKLGGDCTAFASQVLYAGTGVMNYTPVTGWFYVNANNRSPSWTGVQFFYRFLTTNQGAGPVGKEVGLADVKLGDFIQLSFDGQRFGHTLVVVSAGAPATIHTVRISTHTYDAYDRPLSSYSFSKMRCIHILGYHTY